MFSIGELSRQTGVKVPTIRYYECQGLLQKPERSEGNQRRYDKAGLERLSFIKHARELGFSLEAISSLIELQNHDDYSCYEANKIAEKQLHDVTVKIKKLKALQGELRRISQGCDGDGTTDKCYVLASLADHKHCSSEH
jgi:DNA-binding transcriptional MerR regulator